MTRMKALRADARRACEATGERAFASPVPVAVPLLIAGALIIVAVVVSAVFGLSLGDDLAVYVVAAVLAAVVAHRTVRSLVAGLALALIRPYALGERVRLRSPADGAVVEAEIVRIGAANTTLATDNGLLVVANNLLLRDSPERSACF